MKQKRLNFTLIEMLTVIVILAILAAIVIPIVKDMRKDSIVSSMKSNIRSLQTAVDKYSLEHNGEKPVKGEITLTKPQPIDVSVLYPTYIKSKLDYLNIKDQYYWIDVFGTVWGSTKEAPVDVNRVDNKLEWSIPESIKGYTLYEVQDNQTTGALVNQKMKKVNERILPEKTDKIIIPMEHPNSIYLLSTIDNYGLESAPVGLNYSGKGDFPPIFSGDGTYEFELDNRDDMYWDKFWVLEDKPEGTSITYQFSIKDEEGKYGEYVEDFYSLKPSKGMKIRIEMKSFEGKKPSLYNMRVFYHYKDEPKAFYPSVRLDSPYSGWTGGNPIDASTGKTGDTGGSGSIDNPIHYSGDPSLPEPTFVCGTGGTQTNINRYGNILDGSNTAFVTYTFKMPKNYFIKNVSIPAPNGDYGSLVSNMWYEYSKGGQPYQKTSSVDIPDESCVKVVYQLQFAEQWINWPPKLYEPKVGIQPNKPDVFIDDPAMWNIPITGIKTPRIKGGVPTAPEPTDKQVLDSNWTTVDTLRFFAHSGDGQITHWIRADITDKQPTNTRILYRYATSNGYYWSNQVDSITKVSDSRSLVIIAYLQVDKDFASNPQQPRPEVTTIRIVHERGTQDLDMVKPTLAIMPVTDNNIGRDIISDTSKVVWTYEAFDPRGREIVDIEWSGDKQETYPVGTYEVKARVLNSSNYWSDWVTYHFDVKQEKPIAAISFSPNVIEVNEDVEWKYSNSIDPDGDSIVKAEWRKDNKSSYAQAGNYEVELRVQDSEGNWSDWVNQPFTVYEKSFLIYRIEAENAGGTCSYCTGSEVNPNASRGQVMLKGTERYGASTMTVPFEGSRIDVTYVEDGGWFNLYVDNVFMKKISTTNTGKFNTYVISALDNKAHILKLEVGNDREGIGKPARFDYFDVYSPFTTPAISNIYAHSIDKNNVESSYNSTSLVPDKNQLKIYYSISKNAKTNIQVKDVTGNAVKTIQSNVNKTGDRNYNQHSIVWKGEDSDGNYVDTGVYTVEITATGVDGVSTTKETFLVSVDNENPIYRIEGESSAFNVSFGSILSVTGMSRDKVRKFNPDYYGQQKVNFTFTGTGFDISYLQDVGDFTVLLDNVQIATVVKNNSGVYTTFSKRNLPLGSHTVSLVMKNTRDQGGKPITMDYVDIFSSDYDVAISNLYGKKEDSMGIVSNYTTNVLIPQNGDNLRTYYTLSKNAYVTAEIQNSSGTTIQTLRSNTLEVGDTDFREHFVAWNGLNSSGQVVPSGTYSVVVKAKSIKGKTVTQNQFNVVVDNITSTRIEAETASVSCASCGIVSNSKASNGNAKYYNPDYWGATSLNLTFTGTGIDVRYLQDASNFEVLMDGLSLSKVTMVNNSEFTTYSIRGLTSGQHTLTLRLPNSRDSGGKKITVDYYDIIKP